MRVGIGYDVHRLVKGRKLILGGVEIPFSRGLLGHSDGDVILHAICDALLGAASAGDIGIHFPNDDPRFKGISSLVLLEETHEIIKGKGYLATNVDVTVVIEQPRMAEIAPLMKEKIAIDWADSSIWYVISGKLSNYGEKYSKWQDKYYSAVRENPLTRQILTIKINAEARLKTVEHHVETIKKLASILENLARRR